MTPVTSPAITVENGVTVVALGPECENLDEHLLDQIRDSILEVSETAVPPVVLLDLSNTKFFGSSFIEVLFRLSNKIDARHGGRFAIAGLTPYCAEVLAITHLDTLWKIFPNRGAGVTGLSAGA